MQISELKKGFWGYRKESVYQYVSALNEEFSAKLIEKDEKHEALLQELRAYNAALESELAAIKQENTEYQKLHAAVSDSIIGAQSYAAQMKSETRAHEQQLRSQLERQVAEQRLQLKGYTEQIEKFRSHLKNLLEGIDGLLQTTQNQAAQLRNQPPEGLEFAFQAEPSEHTALSDEPKAAREKQEVQSASSSDGPLKNMSLFQRKKAEESVENER